MRQPLSSRYGVIAIAVHGKALHDADFTADGDQVIYRVVLNEGVRESQVAARLMYQTIGSRWANNLSAYDAMEAQRFIRYYEDNADISAVVLAGDTYQ